VIVAALLFQAAAMPPQDWSNLPIFPLPRAREVTDGSAYVRTELATGRCKIAAPPVVAPVAILVGTSGQVVRIVPRAIDCPTVEQYTVGYLIGLTRGGPGSALPPRPGWYRLDVTYRW
jgi:hypothetical protein